MLPAGVRFIICVVFYGFFALLHIVAIIALPFEEIRSAWISLGIFITPLIAILIRSRTLLRVAAFGCYAALTIFIAMALIGAASIGTRSVEWVMCLPIGLVNAYMFLVAIAFIHEGRNLYWPAAGRCSQAETVGDSEHDTTCDT